MRFKTVYAIGLKLGATNSVAELIMPNIAANFPYLCDISGLFLIFMDGLPRGYGASSRPASQRRPQHLFFTVAPRRAMSLRTLPPSSLNIGLGNRFLFRQTSVEMGIMGNRLNLTTA